MTKIADGKKAIVDKKFQNLLQDVNRTGITDLAQLRKGS